MADVGDTLVVFGGGLVTRSRYIPPRNGEPIEKLDKARLSSIAHKTDESVKDVERFASKFCVTVLMLSFITVVVRLIIWIIS